MCFKEMCLIFLKNIEVKTYEFWVAAAKKVYKIWYFIFKDIVVISWI